MCTMTSACGHGPHSSRPSAPHMSSSGTAATPIRLRCGPSLLPPSTRSSMLSSPPLVRKPPVSLLNLVAAVGAPGRPDPLTNNILRSNESSLSSLSFWLPCASFVLPTVVVPPLAGCDVASVDAGATVCARIAAGSRRSDHDWGERESEKNTRM